MTELLVLKAMADRKASRVTELATVIGLPPSTLTGALDRLVRRGFLRRGPLPGDRRSVCMMATRKLVSLARGWTVPAETMLRARLSSLSETRRKRLFADLRLLLESLGEEGEGGRQTGEETSSAVGETKGWDAP